MIADSNRVISGQGESAQNKQKNGALASAIDVNDCSIILRVIDGPHARELFLSARPQASLSGAKEQAQAIYSAISSVLVEQGGNFQSIINETIFHREIRSNARLVREARRQVSPNADTVAITEIEQTPVDNYVWLEISIQALIPHTESHNLITIELDSPCSCAGCSNTTGVRFELGDESQFHSGGLYGEGANAYQQTTAMLEAAEKMLHQAGMQFTDVVRTWIYLSDMERDYPQLNQSRREFFKERGIAPPPASTGIGAELVCTKHLLCLCVHAVKSKHDRPRVFMTTPTLNEAPTYGADFSRGLRIEDVNKHALYLSGTASLDETGASVHIEDFDAQADRMLLNVNALLKAQNASFDNVVSATTYVKHAADAKRLLKLLSDAGYHGFAHNVVIAPVCRPELLCETEAFAVLTKTS